MPSLLDLPAELIEIIFEMVKQVGGGVRLLTVSKACLPLVQRILLRRVEVRSWRRLLKLGRLVRRRRRLGKMVTDIDIDLRGQDSHEGRRTKPVTLFRLFHRLPNVERLCVRGSHTFGESVLHPLHCPRILPFPRLASLTLDHALCTSRNPFNFSNLEGLSASCPRLQHLFLDFEHVAGPANNSYLHANLEADLAVRLLTLELTGNLSGNAAVVDLISSFYNLQHLVLVDQAPRPSLFHLLAAVRHPERVIQLELSRSGATSDDEDLGVSLSRFTHLERLALGAHTYLSSLNSVLAALPSLSFLTLGTFNRSVDHQAIAALLTEPTRPPSLWMLEVCDGRGELNTHSRSRWSSRLQVQGMEELVRLAEEHGIMLVGSAVEWAKKAGRTEVSELE
ncbi:hypothetical protein JCM10213_003811 [Rhodosporidiobolus nylandii]